MGNIRVTDLDYSQLKDSLKNFLRDQDEFKDYDFDGSSLQVLLNVLSANSHLLSVYANMVSNEWSVNSAVLRHNIVAGAKALSFVPKTIKASKATVKLSLKQITDYSPVDPEASIKVPQYSKFTATLDGKNYMFTNTTEAVLDYEKDVGGKRVYTGTFDIRDGVSVNEQYIVDTKDPVQRFILSNESVDIDTLIVYVYPNWDKFETKSDGVLYQPAENVVTVKSDSTVYWAQESESGKQELQFGTGTLGKKLADLSVIDVKYLVSQGEITNNITKFTWSDTITNFELHAISTVTNSFGGAVQDDDETIRFRATKTFETQRRAVTALDYKTHINNLYPGVKSITTWGGEDNDPQEFGVVFVSIKPVTGSVLTEAAKTDIAKNIIKPYNIGPITPKFADPETTWLVPTVTVKYNLQEVPSGEGSLKTKVNDEIVKFNNDKLDVFDSYFRHSNLLTSVDKLDVAIKSSLLSLLMKKKITPTLGTSTSYEIKYNNKVKSGTLTTNKFTHTTKTDCYLKDKGDGTIDIVRMNNGLETVVQSKIGTINYATGFINLLSFNPTAIDTGVNIDLSIQPDILDVTPVRNQILKIDNDDIKITMINISEQFLNQINL